MALRKAQPGGFDGAAESTAEPPRHGGSAARLRPGGFSGAQRRKGVDTNVSGTAGPGCGRAPRSFRCAAALLSLPRLPSAVRSPLRPFSPPSVSLGSSQTPLTPVFFPQSPSSPLSPSRFPWSPSAPAEMDDEPERTKRWEGGYERTWEILKEDESGSLKATIEDILFKAKRKRLYEHHGQVRLGMMRHLYVVIDGSRTMEDQDLKPNRLTCTLKLLEYFVEEYFDQNPISQIGLIVTKSKRAEKMTELSGNSKKHVTALKKAVDMNCSGEPSLYNSLNLAMQTLKHMPGHTSREVLVVLSSLTTCDPANIYDLIKCLKAVKVRVSVIGLSAEVRVCTVLARETGGTYHVILDESHYKELLMHHVSPPPASSTSECSLIRMGFPQHTIASLSDQDAKPSFSMVQLENNSDPGLTLGGYFCPQCRAKYCELPVECKICGLTLVSAPHLARSYHHLFPLDAFQEVPLEEYKGERYCHGCQGEMKDQNVYICKVCQNAFCVECDLFVHDSLHCCPGCIHEHPAPISV
uniref:VWFA domain-containing protein n=1 Tax=Taeniopygia guttata TaxID=59729 RepID=H0YTJ1_TAEGU